jgi:hypothetical protein
MHSPRPKSPSSPHFQIPTPGILISSSLSSFSNMENEISLNNSEFKTQFPISTSNISLSPNNNNNNNNNNVKLFSSSFRIPQKDGLYISTPSIKLESVNSPSFSNSSTYSSTSFPLFISSPSSPSPCVSPSYSKPGYVIITERHRHRFEFNNNFKDIFAKNGIIYY